MVAWPNLGRVAGIAVTRKKIIRMIIANVKIEIMSGLKTHYSLVN